MGVKLIFTFLALLAFVSLGQAQTKEETIAWIKEKFEKYHESGTYKKKSLESKSSDGVGEWTYSLIITPCYIKLKYSVSDIYPGNIRAGNFKDISFNPSTAKWSTSENGEVISDKKIIELDVISYSEHSNEYVNNMPFFDYSKEANLAERMAKALNHLATFCEETKNETF